MKLGIGSNRLDLGSIPISLADVRLSLDRRSIVIMDWNEESKRSEE